MDMRFGTWNVRGLYRAVSLETAASEMAKYKNTKGKEHLEDLGVEGSITLKRILVKIGWDGVNWIHLAQDRNQRRALVATIMNLRVPARRGICWLASQGL
jgi:hypothetical protein